VEATVADTCKQNQLSLREVLPDNTERASDTYEYQITKLAVADPAMTFYGRKVHHSVDDCEVETTVEYYNGIDQMWGEIRPSKDEDGNDKVTMNLAPDSMQFTATLNQDDFLESYIGEFETEMSANGEAIAVLIPIRFTTKDVVSNSTVYDYINIKVKSSEETEAQRCSFTTLTVTNDNMSTDPFVYNIGKDDENPFQKEIYAPITLNGLDARDNISQKCASQVHMGLDFKTTSGRWQSIWSERHTVAKQCEALAGELDLDFSTQTKSNGAPAGCIKYNDNRVIYVETCTNHDNCGTYNCNGCSVLDVVGSDENVMKHDTYTIWMMDVTQNDFTESIRREFNLANDVMSHTVELRFVYRDGEEKAIASTATPFEVTINARTETEAHPCADAEV
jgi:hypothetical protein